MASKARKRVNRAMRERNIPDADPFPDYRPAMDEAWEKILRDAPEDADSDEAAVAVMLYAALAGRKANSQVTT